MVAVDWWVWWCDGFLVLLLKCGYNDEDPADGFEFAFFLLFYFLFFIFISMIDKFGFFFFFFGDCLRSVGFFFWGEIWVW